MGDLKELTVEEFTGLTASDAPSPGGGGVSALVGALAAALSEMVANLTIGRGKYAGVQEEMEALAGQAAALRSRLLDDIQKDSVCFNACMAALRMPRETKEQQEARREAIQEGLKEASAVPLSIAETAAGIFPIAEEVVKKGNQTAVSDGLLAAMLARTAVLGALLNVKINLASIRDEAFVRETASKTDQLEGEAVTWEAKILKASGFLQVNVL